MPRFEVNLTTIKMEINIMIWIPIENVINVFLQNASNLCTVAAFINITNQQ